ncbi:DeoR family transcriptional regulator [Aureimonas sp. SA4125]|uniref:DeoR/GlpR family DNA-binding transcription regulator n=1 Tax=Aureimonas sp. SA4125 TaxID=2826993 RepID=UPI001CC65474|nr:DeoR/GlpR family DNA-binding transcription regulator [Aureimonas sp. SA4125]BDA86247.1 DeoR family transcriptional regulator [Aureimonas sp. SA4125]
MDSQLLTSERQAKIRALLEAEGRVLAAPLAKRFHVSEDTVRRDLRDLAQAGLCRRVYGGAVPLAPSEGSLTRRQNIAPARKAALARAVTAMIDPGTLLFIDAGSTNLAVADALAENAGLTVVTNAPLIACALLERPGIETILIGGRVDAVTGACFGPKALADAQRFRPDVLILGACGIDADEGVTGHVFEECELKAALASRSRRIFVAAANDKIGTAAPYTVIPTDRISALFVESDCDLVAVAAMEALGVAVMRAEPEVAGARQPRALRT